jgi:hypothetical protein
MRCVLLLAWWAGWLLLDVTWWVSSSFCHSTVVYSIFNLPPSSASPQSDCAEAFIHAYLAFGDDNQHFGYPPSHHTKRDVTNLLQNYSQQIEGVLLLDLWST